MTQATPIKMGSDQILVDFILPQFEDPRILRAIRSITSHAQSRYFRLIVQDAGRDPHLRKQIADTLRSTDLHVCESDSGIFDAINKALTHVEAPWVGWLGADDFLSNHFSIEPLLRASLDDAFVSYITLFFDDESGIVTRVYRPVGIRWCRRLGCHLPHFSTFVRRQVLLGRTFAVSERNYADQIFFFDLETDFEGAVTAQVSTCMAEGGASNRSTRGILQTNRQVLYSFHGRKSPLGATVYVVVKLFYKLVQRLEGLIRKRQPLAEWSNHGG